MYNNSFMDTQQGHILAQTIIRSLPELVEQLEKLPKKQYTVSVGEKELATCIEHEIACGSKYVTHISDSNRVVVVFTN